MDILLAFGVFLISMLACILTGTSMVPGLAVSYVAFCLVGLHRKCSIKDLLRLSLKGMYEVRMVAVIMLVIGILTATWRMSGTILYFVYYGVNMISPSLFILMAFLLTSLIAYALGTSFGVSATVGVILMAIARSGGVNPALAAGAIFSGVYFGDRGSPVSSAAHVVAAMTDTDMPGNVRWMHRTAALPFLLSAAIYAVFSYFNPVGTVDPTMLTAIETDFVLSHALVIPVIIMLVLPLFRISTLTTCAFSIAAAGIISVMIQGMDVSEVIKACIFGYEPAAGALGDMLSGGGITSMIEVDLVLLISCTYSKIFEATGVLDEVSAVFEKLIGRFGRFVTNIILSIASVAVFCNQTMGSIVCATLLREPYHRDGATDREFAIDLENSVILIGGLVPWSIASSAPLGFMGADASALPYACFLYLVPICYLLTKKRFNFNE